jgi:hypothetical protein
MTKKFKTFIIKDRLYFVDIIVMVGDVNRYHKFMKKYIPNHEINDGMVGECWNIKKGKKYYKTLWVKDFKYTPDRMNTLSHEILHLGINILTTREILITNNSEPLAYYIGWLTEEILTKLKK